MSRRPVAANPVQRAGDVRRRLWSEAPIPRVATRRVRNLAVPPGTYLSMDKNAAGAPGVDAEFYGATGLIRTGDPVIVVAFGHGTVAAPAGWNTLASGTVNDMGYVVAWVPFAGSLDESGNYTGPLDLTFPCSGTTQLLTFHYRGATPTATVTEHPATTGFALPGGAWTVVGVQYDSGWSSFSLSTTASIFTTYSVSRTYGLVPGVTAPAASPGSTVTLGGSGAPAPDAIAVTLGWV